MNKDKVSGLLRKATTQVARAQQAIVKGKDPLPMIRDAMQDLDAARQEVAGVPDLHPPTFLAPD